MKAMKYILALVLSGVACWFNVAMDDWRMLQTFSIAPINAYSIKVVALSMMIFVIGYCCGIGFKKTARTSNVFMSVFLVVMVIHIIIPLLRAMLATGLSETILVIYANMGLLTYLSALLAGLSLGSPLE